MFAVHGVFRDTLGAAPALVGGVAPGDAERVALIANYYENILSFLEAHHDGEEKLVFPLLRERCAGDGALIDRMAEQHDEALALLEEAQALAGGVARRATRAAQQAAAGRAWTRCARSWSSISTEEEQKVLPLAARAPLRRGVGRPARATAWPTSTATRSG